MLSFKKSASSRSMLQYLVFETCIKTRSTAVKGFSLEPSYDVCIFSEENLLNIGALLLSVDLTTVRIYLVYGEEKQPVPLQILQIQV